MKDMNTLDPQEVKHTMRKPTRLSCAKPLCQRSNCRVWDVRGLKLLATVEAEGKIPAGSANIPEEESTNEILEAWDDASGEDLDPAIVLAARREEIAYYKEMKAFTKVPISQCVARTGRKPIGARWRDINKGDRYNVNVRSRLVAKEFNNKKCDDLFAGTPPVEAMRAIISMAASGATPKTLMTVDLSRAYMYAKCRNEMYVGMCPEAYEEDGDEKVLLEDGRSHRLS